MGTLYTSSSRVTNDTHITVVAIVLIVKVKSAADLTKCKNKSQANG